MDRIGRKRVDLGIDGQGIRYEDSNYGWLVIFYRGRRCSDVCFIMSVGF